MCMVTEVRPTRATDARNRTVSPTRTGFLNSTRFRATVTNAASTPPRRRISRRAAIDPAMSMYDRITPPKMVPYGFAWLGIMTIWMAVYGSGIRGLRGGPAGAAGGLAVSYGDHDRERPA